MTSAEMLHNLTSGLWKQYWWFFLLVIFWPLLKLFIPVIKGKVGEGVVNLAAKHRLDPNVYHLLKDVTIPAGSGSTQIDHVIVSKFGLFVIETKNYKGWIFADAKDAKWMQNIYGRKYQFQNPLRQNYAHVCALAELLDLPPEKIHGVVCFMGDATFKTGVPEGVFLEGRYVNHIESFQSVVFSAEEVAGLIRKIESSRLERGFKTNRQHVQQLSARMSESRGFCSVKTGADGGTPPSRNGAGQICPVCGAAMVLRTARKGANAGNQFWGCSKYPTCKSTLPFTG